MKHVICLAVASLLATSANAAEMKWSGSAGYRYEQTSFDTGAGGNAAEIRNKAHGYRANLGVTGGWENVEWGVAVRTNNGTIANDDHVFAGGASNFGIGFEQAWFRYVREFGSLDFSVTAGRQKNVFAYDSVSQNLFDNDVRFDGLGWQFKFGMFSLNAAQYTLGSQAGVTNAGTSNVSVTDASTLTPGAQRLTYLFGIQPTMNWKFSDDIEAMFGVGYYYWKDDTNLNALGGSALPASFAGTPVNATTGLGAYRIGNPRQWQFTTAWTLPYSLSFNGEFVMNKSSNFNNAATGTTVTAFPEVSRTAWSAGLTYGSLKKAHDFSVGYAYGSKGIGAVINRYTHEKFQADNKGHTIRAAYALADNFHIGARAILTKEIEQVGPTGTAKTQQAKNNYWELTGGVMF
jgi:hypothetical protein